MKRVITFSTIFCVAAMAAAYAQGAHAMVDVLVKHWETSKALTLAVADAMPESDYSFKATSAEMSFGEQMNHIAKADGSYCSAAVGAANPISGTQENTKAEATKNLTTAYDFCIDGLKKMSDADLMKMVGKAPHQTTAFERFWGGFTHSAHHRGQAEVYLRLKNVTPPGYQF